MKAEKVQSVIEIWLSKRSFVGSGLHPDLVDFAIGCAGRWPGFKYMDNEWKWDANQTIPPFTTNFKAARALIPADCQYRLWEDKSDAVCPVVEVWSWREEEPLSGIPIDSRRADMETVEEAIAAGALKARARARMQGMPVITDTDAELELINLVLMKATNRNYVQSIDSFNQQTVGPTDYYGLNTDSQVISQISRPMPNTNQQQNTTNLEEIVS